MEQVGKFFKGHTLFLFILPIIYCMLWMYCYSQAHTFYTTYPDSIYIYLINGTNIAGGNFNIGHFDNPGTPVHLLAGLIIYIAHFFIDTLPVHESVFSNPELYLKICVSIIALCSFFAVYWSGKLILKYTGDLFLAILFQLIPICSYCTIHQLLLVRMGPENLMIIILILYYAYIWLICYKKEQFGRNYFTGIELMLVSIVTAILITTKITCLPLVIFPLFFIEKNSSKITYVFLTILFSFLILFPIWSKFQAMFNWYTQLATHSGAYGTGKAGVSLDLMMTNLIRLLTFEKTFAVFYAFLFIVSVVGGFRKKWTNYFYKFTLASFIVCFVQLLLASKQFGYHYLIPSQLLMIPATTAAIIAICGMDFNRTLNFIGVFICLFLFSFTIKKEADVYRAGNPVYESLDIAKKHENIPKIITTGYQGSSFVQSALRFGAAYGGESFQQSSAFLKKQHPDTYFFDIFLHGGTIKSWNTSISREALFEKNEQLLIYFRGEETATEEKMIHDLISGFDATTIRYRLSDDNKNTGERFYLLEIDTKAFQSHYENDLFFKLGISQDEIKKANSRPLRCLLKTVDGKHIVVDSIKKTLSTNTTNKKQEERFEIINLGYGKIALKGLNGKFVCADLTKEKLLVADRDVAYTWETFEVVLLKEEKFALKTISGTYVSVNDSGVLIANATVISNSEIFSFDL